MEQLSGRDALFLAVETDTIYAHIGGLTILDPTGAPGFGYARLIEIAGERLRQVPRFTKKLRRVPFDLDHPSLVDDPDLEVEKHIHRIAVPSPRGLRELAEVVGHLYARHLDRRKSLWEIGSSRGSRTVAPQFSSRRTTRSWTTRPARGSPSSSSTRSRIRHRGPPPRSLHDLLLGASRECFCSRREAPRA